MIRSGMWGPGFALPSDPPTAITLADCGVVSGVFWVGTVPEDMARTWVQQ